MAKFFLSFEDNMGIRNAAVAVAAKSPALSYSDVNGFLVPVTYKGVKYNVEVIRDSGNKEEWSTGEILLS